MELEIGDPIPVAELMAKPSKGRQLTPRDLALDALVMRVALEENADNAFPWKYSPEKLVTARAAALRSVKRTNMTDKVFVSTKNDQLWFSQKRLSNRGRKGK